MKNVRICLLVALVLIIALIFVACNFRGQAELEKIAFDNGIFGMVDRNKNECAIIGIGDCKDSDLIIPSSYKNIPVTEIEMRAFKDCTQITSVTIPDSVRSIGYETFSGCINLSTINIPDKLAIIGPEAFLNTAWYNSRPDGEVYLKNVFYKFKGEMEETTDFVLEEGVLGISGDAFYGCRGLRSVTIPSSTVFVNAGAFQHCPNLMSICVAENNSSYMSFDGILYSKNKKQFVHIPESLQGSVTILDGITTIYNRAFSSTKITEVKIPKSVTEIEDEAFLFCCDLKTISIPKNVVRMGYNVFEGTPWFDALPDGVNYINNVAYIYKGEMPQGTSIVLREGTISIAGNAFSNCSGLASITLPQGLVYIGHAAFSGCTGLTELTVPNGVAEIGGWAFVGCENIAQMNIPGSVKKLGILAFSRCENLKNIYFGGSKSEWESLIEYMTWGDGISLLTTHCTDGDVYRE